MFGNNTGVAFGDINLSEAPIRGNHNPGAGGWPTIRYFNKETGPEGGSYVKVTDDAMCQELLDYDNMINYVEGYGNTILCDVSTEKNCNDKEKKFLAKFKAESAEDQQNELNRLQGMDEKKIKPDTYDFMLRRMRILKALLKGGGATGVDGGEDDKKEEL
mmetsp:Transcript_24206/g.35862  ORF Transcript_24206/g.35862 Transcript_24206/m.35862 type:complete len:160 (-) Transcript_24206:342-821(-)